MHQFPEIANAKKGLTEEPIDQCVEET